MSKILDGLPGEGTMSPLVEDQLATKIQQHQNEEDKNTLVLHNMREGIRYAMGVSKNHLPEDEIMSTVYIALSKASKNFKPGGIRFFGYAKPYIRGEICLLWKQKDVVKNASRHESIEGKPPLRRVNYFSDQEQEVEKVDEKDHRLDEDFVLPDYKGIDLREKWEMVEPLMNKILNERENMVLQLFYIGGMSFHTIGQKLVPKMDRPAIQHIHLRALKKLRTALAKNKALLP